MKSIYPTLTITSEVFPDDYISRYIQFESTGLETSIAVLSGCILKEIPNVTKLVIRLVKNIVTDIFKQGSIMFAIPTHMMVNEIYKELSDNEITIDYDKLETIIDDNILNTEDYSKLVEKFLCDKIINNFNLSVSSLEWLFKHNSIDKERQVIINPEIVKSIKTYIDYTFLIYDKYISKFVKRKSYIKYNKTLNNAKRMNIIQKLTFFNDSVTLYDMSLIFNELIDLQHYFTKTNNEYNIIDIPYSRILFETKIINKI